MENSNNRNITLSTKVTAEQKAEYTKIATKHNISLSEWSASILEINKDSYDKIGDPTLREIALEDKVRKQEQQIKKLVATLESADHRVEVEMKRADDAIFRCDEILFNLKNSENENKRLQSELDQFKTQSKINNSVVKSKNENQALILPLIVISGVIGLVIGKK